jgi:hypothetical protein
MSEVERLTIKGKPAKVMWLDADRNPVDRQQATQARVLWDDGTSAFLNVPRRKAKATTEKKSPNSRNPPGKPATVHLHFGEEQ